MRSGRAWRLRYSRGFWLAFLAVLGLGLVVFAAARKAPVARLLDVTGIGPELVEQGSVLELTGRGFPAGQPGTVVFSGATARPGRASHPVSLRVPGRAVSAERVEVDLDAVAARELGERGTFHGAIEVRFAAVRGGEVVGSLSDASFDLAGASVRSVAQEDALRSRGAALLSASGLSLRESDGGDAGLQVAGVVADSVAARAGLRAGDLLTQLAGVRLYTLSDLAPPPAARKATLQVVRAGVVEPLSLSLPLARDQAASHATLPPALLYALVMALLGSWFLGPWASPSLFLARALSRLRVAHAGPRAWLGPALSGLGADRGWARMVLPLSCAALLFGLAWLASARVLVVDALLLLSVVVVASFSGAWQRPRRELLAALGHVIVLFVAVAAALVHAGSRELSASVAQQAASPDAWTIARHPELLPAFVLFVVHAARLLALATARSAVSLAMGLSARLSLAYLAASLFLGGHAQPMFADAAWPTWLLALLFATKMVAVVWALSLCQAIDLGARHQARRAALWLALVVAVTGLELFAPKSPQLLLALGQITTWTLCGAALIALANVLLVRSPMGEAPRHTSPLL